MTPTGTVQRMTVDVSRPRMPGAVLAALILLAVFGGLTGLALLAIGGAGWLSEGAFYGNAALPLGLLGALILAMTVLGTIGLVKGNRGAQIVAVTIGAIWFAGGMVGLGTNPVAALVALAAGAALVMLVVVPVSSRDWFAS